MLTPLAMFDPLSRIDVMDLGEDGRFGRGSFFFRENTWSVEEMAPILYEIGKRSIHYYFAKRGEDAFH